MSFIHAAFTIAGLIAAAGPVIIHLLNRRRFRTVEWGAMAFLRKAVQQSRRAVRLRDLFLLMARTAAVLLFGLALARPYVASEGMTGAAVVLSAIATLATFGGAIGFVISQRRKRRGAWGATAVAGAVSLAFLFAGPGRSTARSDIQSSSRQPVHAIFIIDNSRSMATRMLGGTLLDAAKRRVDAAMAELPPNSRISVLPLCGPERSFTLDAFRHLDDARASLARISITDRAGSVSRMLSLASEAAERAVDLPAKHVVLLTDLQATDWPRGSIADALKDLDVPVQIAEVSLPDSRAESADPPNVWIDSFDIQDGLAESGLPTTFFTRVRSTADSPVQGVELVITVDDVEIASQTIDLRPGESRDLILTAPLDAAATPGAPVFVPVSIALRVPDPALNVLDRDDVRHLAVPVVTAMPVVFVDQFGDQESLDAGRIGETYRLRRLLAPRPAEGVYESLVSLRHLTIEQLSTQTLEDARLVVLAGVERPTSDAVTLLRQYVEQGGPLVIAAGANFDPAAWTEIAWLDGQGVLPAPLAPAPVGIRPSQATGPSQINPFRLETSSMRHPFFVIAGESSESLRNLWSQAFFFQTVAADVSEDAVRTAVEEEARRITAERELLAEGQADPELAPSWLLWKNERRAALGDNPDVARGGADSADDLARRTAPAVLAEFVKPGPNGRNLPYVIERQMGYGRVVMLTAGISSDWDTLAQTNAIVLLDRITRSLLEETLPRREFEAGGSVVLPVQRMPDVIYTLTPPRGETRAVPLDATGTGFAVRLEDTSVAGIYTVNMNRDSNVPVETNYVSVNGPVSESDLTRITAAQLSDRLGDANVRLLGPEEAITFTGGPAGRDEYWKWLVGLVLACLIAEMAIASRWRVSRTEVAT